MTERQNFSFLCVKETKSKMPSAADAIFGGADMSLGWKHTLNIFIF